MTTDDLHRIRARQAMSAARRGHLPKPTDATLSASIAPSLEDVFEKARENSIEVYEDQFSRNSILTRSARVRKFKFYQYKPIREQAIENRATKLPVSNPTDGAAESVTAHSQNSHSQSPTDQSVIDIAGSASKSALQPRDDVLQGKVALIQEQSQELTELDEQIVETEKVIAGIARKCRGLEELMKEGYYDLVNKKNGLVRRQMQLNLMEQEKVLEKTLEELTKELRWLMSIDDSRKTKCELERQKYLCDQRLALVNKRNELVHQMDMQEQQIEEDEELKATLKSAISNASTRPALNGNDQNCSIM